MDVMTVATLNQAFIHPMVEGHLEFRFLSQVARVAELGLRLGEQKVRFFTVVWRVAGNATDAILRMFRIDCIHMLRATGMAGQAALIYFLG